MSKVEVNSENFKKYLEIISEINNYISNIEKESGGFSTPRYINHTDYQKLLSMGDKIIPYLFHYAIQEHGFSWMLLSIITELSGETPVLKEHYGRFNHQVSDWMNWFIKSKYIEYDVYHNLID